MLTSVTTSNVFGMSLRPEVITAPPLPAMTTSEFWLLMFAGRSNSISGDPSASALKPGPSGPFLRSMKRSADIVSGPTFTWSMFVMVACAAGVPQMLSSTRRSPPPFRVMPTPEADPGETLASWATESNEHVAPACLDDALGEASADTGRESTTAHAAASSARVTTPPSLGFSASIRASRRPPAMPVKSSAGTGDPPVGRRVEQDVRPGPNARRSSMVTKAILARLEAKPGRRTRSRASSRARCRSSRPNPARSPGTRFGSAPRSSASSTRSRRRRPAGPPDARSPRP